MDSLPAPRGSKCSISFDRDCFGDDFFYVLLYNEINGARESLSSYGGLSFLSLFPFFLSPVVFISPKVLGVELRALAHARPSHHYS